MGTLMDERTSLSGEDRTNGDSFEADSDQEFPPTPRRADRVMITADESDSQPLSGEDGNNSDNFEADSDQEFPPVPRRTPRFVDRSSTRPETSELIAHDGELSLAPEEVNTPDSTKEIDARHPLPSLSGKSATEDRLCDNCRQINFEITTDLDDNIYGTTTWKLSAPPLDTKFPETCSLCSFFSRHVVRWRLPGQRLHLFAKRLSVVYGYDNFPRHLDGLAMYFATYPFLTALEGERGQASGYFVRLSADRLSGSETQPIDYEVIREWLSLCSSVHCECVEKHQSLDFHDIPGFRLIDCSTGTMILAAQASEREYVTLSYVWGSSSNNSSPAATSSLPDNLPLVVEDAMKVTVSLGYRYIWIDRYCIAQDDLTIKHGQIQSMDKIYSRSTLTIIAAAGNDAAYGLPGVSSRARSRQFIATFDDGRTKLTAVRFAHWNILDSNWCSRGWTFQEALMAKRRLAFTDHQVFFQCQNTHTSDDWKLPPNTFGVSVKKHTHDDPFHSLNMGQSYEAAWDTIGHYLKRDLTYDSDALNAISGVLNSFPSGQVRFLCGLPISNTSDSSSLPTPGDLTDLLDPLFAGFTRNDFYLPGDVNMAVLVTALLWRSDWLRRGPVPHAEPSCVRRREFPSWTWAGWKTTEEWDMRFASPTVERLHLSDTEQLIRSTINITFGDSVLSWSDASEKILDLSDQGMIPSIMTIVGKVFDIKLKCVDKGFRFTGFPWLITCPPLLEVVPRYKSRDTDDGATCHPPGILEEEIGETQDLIALLLTVGTFRDELCCKFLLLRPVEQGIDGPIYERVTSCEATINKRKFMEGKKEQQSGSPLLQLRSMKVTIR